MRQQNLSTGNPILKDTFFSRKRKPASQMKDYTPAGWGGPGKLLYRTQDLPVKAALRRRIKGAK